MKWIYSQSLESDSYVGTLICPNFPRRVTKESWKKYLIYWQKDSCGGKSRIFRLLARPRCCHRQFFVPLGETNSERGFLNEYFHSVLDTFSMTGPVCQIVDQWPEQFWQPICLTHSTYQATTEQIQSRTAANLGQHCRRIVALSCFGPIL